MALRWVVHTACHVLGHQNGNNVAGSFQNQTDDHQAIMKKKKKKKSGSSSSSSTAKVLSSSSSNGGLSQIQSYPPGVFQIPLHYPRYSKADYETMEEWKIDRLLGEYGFSFDGSLHEKRAYAMGAFLWPDQY